MNINKNLKLINLIIRSKRFNKNERLNIVNIAKVSFNKKELIENIEWETDR